MTSPANGLMTILLPEPGEEENTFIGMLGYDLDNSGDISQGDPTTDFHYIYRGDQESLVCMNDFPYYTNWMSRHTFATSDDLFSSPGIDVDWAYEGTNLSIKNHGDTLSSPGDAYICNIFSDSSAPADWGSFDNLTNSHIRYFKVEGSDESDRCTLLGFPADTSYYHIMLFDCDGSGSLTEGDYYNISSAITTQQIGYTAPIDRAVDDGDLTEYGASPAVNNGALNVTLNGDFSEYEGATARFYLAEPGSLMENALTSQSTSLNGESRQRERGTPLRQPWNRDGRV